MRKLQGMATTELKHGIKRGLFFRRSKDTQFLLNSEQFRFQMECERMRVDRNGSTLSILKIQFAKTAARAAADRLGSICHRRLRMTDTCGWTLDGCVGVLLPDTPYDGAMKVARDLSELCAGCIPGLDIDIMTYPDAPEAGDDSDSQDRASASSGVEITAFFATPLPWWKRAMDVLLASVALISAIPAICLAAVAIKLSTKGPIFFSQEREGLGGRLFRIYKLRTMRMSAEREKSDLRALSHQDGPAFKVANDPRLTGLGYWLRKFSIDELPQLWNVLRGDMSLVGPRPLPTEESRRCSRWQRRRLEVTPGLTCIWQVAGRSRVRFDEWMRMDLQYVRSRSLSLDLRLLAATIPAVLSGRGAH